MIYRLNRIKSFLLLLFDFSICEQQLLTHMIIVKTILTNLLKSFFEVKPLRLRSS